MGIRYFFDLPVYRLQRERYYQDKEKHIQKVLSPIARTYAELGADFDIHETRIRGHLQKSYGGCWEFNEIMGYIRLHFLGSQVRGEYYAVTKKRIVRTRRKMLEYQTHKLAPEVEIPHPATGNDVLNAVREYIEDCRKELKGRYIDTSIFDTLAPYTDWSALYLYQSQD
jgi:hypothetical protein